MLISADSVGQISILHRNVIQAAKKAGVKYIAYLSCLHAERQSLEKIGPEHFISEEDIKASGIPYTFLRTSWFTDNYYPLITAVVGGMM